MWFSTELDTVLPAPEPVPDRLAEAQSRLTEVRSQLAALDRIRKLELPVNPKAGPCTMNIGLIGDMMNRQRVYLEELLYRQRDGAWRDAAAEATPARSEESVRAAAHREESSVAV